MIKKFILCLLPILLFFSGCSVPEQTTKTSLPTQTSLAPTSTPIFPTVTLVSTATLPPTPVLSVALPSGWKDRVLSLRWVSYTPPSADPNKGEEASQENIRLDLSVLRSAGFTGLVTYSAKGVMGRVFPKLAQEAKFEGLIMGVWNPSDQEEIANVTEASKLPIILGICVGNEGLDQKDRYNWNILTKTIEKVRKETGKPVTTTEEVDDYSSEDLMALGDWIFPNVHPYFHNQLDPTLAVEWTAAAYDDFIRRTGRFIFFKEVGLPTAGDPRGILTETSQEIYYSKLAQTKVKFVYFEGFDQPWKTQLPIEPHWGLFISDNKPKLIAWKLMGLEPPIAVDPAQGLAIYQEADASSAPYVPSGYMGDTGDIEVNLGEEKEHHTGNYSIKVIYSKKGTGPNVCEYAAPCKWGGVYWQKPANNWGKDEALNGEGLNLSAYSYLSFWAKAKTPCVIDFFVGGIVGPYGDSLKFPRKIQAKLTEQWQEFKIPLKDANLSYIIGGFGWSMNESSCPGVCTFYLDDIIYRK